MVSNFKFYLNANSPKDILNPTRAVVPLIPLIPVHWQTGTFSTHCALTSGPRTLTDSILLPSTKDHRHIALVNEEIVFILPLVCGVNKLELENV